MDVGYFLKGRTVFISQFYENACREFAETKRKIEAKEEPFVPPYSEDSEPLFLEEWMEADDSLNVLGYACISMLSAALRLYMETWASELQRPVEEKYFNKAGSWFEGFRRYFAGEFKIIFEDSHVSLSSLKEIVLVRNAIQHPQTIEIHKTTYSEKAMSELRHPFFVNETERKMSLGMDETERSWLWPPTVEVTNKKLDTAIDVVNAFCSWLDNEIVTRVFKTRK